jgi:hypothetical protein
MKSVMAKSYWNRVWVVQEVILPRTLEVWLGEYRADADELRELLLSYEYYYFVLPNEYDEPLDSIPGLKLLKCRRLFWNMRDPNTHFFRNRDDWPWEFELRWRLEKFSTSQCSLLHDRVYGLLGLVYEKTRSAYPIVPDYDKPMLELFIDVLKNQSASGEPDKWKERDLINLFRRALDVGRMELTAYSAGFGSPGIDKNLFSLARGIEIEPIVSLQFIDTVDIISWEPYNRRFHRPKNGVQLSLPLEVQTAVDGFTAKPEERLDALDSFLEYCWLDADAVPTSIDSIGASQRVFIDALLDSSQSPRATGIQNIQSVSTIANTMCEGITLDTQKCLASVKQQAAIGTHTEFPGDRMRYHSATLQAQSRIQLAVFSGATHSQNALMLVQGRGGTYSPEGDNIYFLEGQYSLAGIAFPLNTESPRHPRREFRLSRCGLPGLMDLRRLDVLNETQLKTVLEQMLATGERSSDEGEMGHILWKYYEDDSRLRYYMQDQIPWPQSDSAKK